MMDEEDQFDESATEGQQFKIYAGAAIVCLVGIGLVILNGFSGQGSPATPPSPAVNPPAILSNPPGSSIPNQLNPLTGSQIPGDLNQGAEDTAKAIKFGAEALKDGAEVVKDGVEVGSEAMKTVKGAAESLFGKPPAKSKQQ